MTKWIQLKIDSQDGGELTSCEVRMVAVYRGNEIVYDEPLDCVWSNTNFSVRNIRPRIPEFANLFMTVEGDSRLQPATSVGKPQLVLPAGTYRIDVAVCALNAATERRLYVLEYGGSYDIVDFRPG